MADFKVKNGLTASGNVTLTSGTAATTSATGALVVTGGAGISGNIYVGTNANVAGNLLTLNANLGNLAKANFFQGDGYLISNLMVGAGSSIVNGTSNVSVAPSGNVTVGITGAANVLTVTATGANILGTANVSGNANVGNIGANNVVATSLSGANLSVTGTTNLNAIGNITITGGSVNNVIQTSGSGVLSWVQVATAAQGALADTALQPGQQAAVGTASTFYLDGLVAIADNKFLSPAPSGEAEATLAATVASGTNGGIGLLKRFVSGPLGITTIPAGDWTFNNYCSTSSVQGTSTKVVSQINKRVALTSLQGTFTGTTPGFVRTFTMNPHTIIGVNTGAKTFTVAGSHSYAPGRLITVLGSTGNNGTYTVVSAIFGGVNTDIIVAETVPSAVADGTLRSAPFVAGDIGDGTVLTASLIETPTQTAWITGFVNTYTVAVYLTDTAFVNVSTTLDAMYYLLFNTTAVASNLPVTNTTYSFAELTIQPSFTGLTLTDRLVAAYFAVTTGSTSRTVNLYYGGTNRYTHIHTSLSIPIVTQTITDGVTATAPSENAVFAALALKAPSISPSFTSPALGTPTSGNLVNCTFPTLNQNTTGYAATVSSNAQANITSVGLLTGLTVGNLTSNTFFGNGIFTATGNANVGNIRATNLLGTTVNVSGQLITTVATGTAPLVVSSTTTVANLNVAGASLATLATTANNIAAGTIGSIPYQSGPNTTAFIAPVAAGNYLTSNGGAIPVWTAIPAAITPGNGTVTVGNATAATNVSVFLSMSNVFGANSTIGTVMYANVGPAISNLASVMGNASIGFVKKTAADTYSFDSSTYLTAEADTLQTVTTRGNTTANIISFTNATAATTTATGAVIVTGGMGVGGNVYVGLNAVVSGALYATSKSFRIDHPTKPGKKLVYGSLEGPEHSVYVRGSTTENVIELPDHWTGLVDQESITVNLTARGRGQQLYVDRTEDNKVYIGNDNLFSKSIDCFYTVFAERVDISKLEVEPE